MISAALLLTALAAPQSPRLFASTEPVFVLVEAGRGSLLAGEASTPITKSDGEQWVEGRGHLSLVASSKAELRWHRRASITLYGPCEIEWQPAAPGAAIEWSFKELNSASIEIRRGAAEIALGNSWIANIPRGALELRGLPSGGYEVFQEAGDPATYQWHSSATLARPAREGAIGKNVRLMERATTSIPDLSVELEGRDSWTWPWREESENSSDWQRSDWPWVASAPIPTKVLITVKPQETVALPEPPQIIEVELEAKKPAEPVAPQQLVEVVAPPKKATQEPEGDLGGEGDGGDGTWGSSTKRESEDGWRGNPEEGYERFGEYYIQRGAGIKAWRLPDGSIRFSVPEDSRGGGWVLGPLLDARINSGGSVEYLPNRALKNHSGAVRVLATIERQ